MLGGVDAVEGLDELGDLVRDRGHRLHAAGPREVDERADVQAADRAVAVEAGGQARGGRAPRGSARRTRRGARARPPCPRRTRPAARRPRWPPSAARARPCGPWSARPGRPSSRRAACGSRGRARARPPRARRACARVSASESPLKETNSSASGSPSSMSASRRYSSLERESPRIVRSIISIDAAPSVEPVLRGGDRAGQRVEVPDREHRRARELDQPHGRRRDRDQRALRARDELREVEPARGGEAVEPVAARLAPVARVVLGDRAGVALERSRAARAGSRPRACPPARAAPTRPRRPRRSVAREPSASTTSSSSTWSIVVPWRIDALPEELLPIMPPSVARLEVEVSGPKPSPCGFAAALSASCTTPGSTRTRAARDVDLADRVEVARVVEHDPAPARGLAREARAAAARDDGHAVLGRRSRPPPRRRRRCAGTRRAAARPRTCSRRRRTGGACRRPRARHPPARVAARPPARRRAPPNAPGPGCPPAFGSTRLSAPPCLP